MKKIIIEISKDKYLKSNKALHRLYGEIQKDQKIRKCTILSNKQFEDTEFITKDGKSIMITWPLFVNPFLSHEVFESDIYYIIEGTEL